MSGRFIIIAGPSASGKTTIVDALLKRYPDSKRLVTTTTRSIRPGERQGEHYYFITKDEFEQGIKQGKFLEYNVFADNYYGSSKERLEEALKSAKHVFAIIDVNGIEALRPQVEDMSVVFVNPGTLDDIRARLKKTRPDMPEEDIMKRLRTAEREMSLAHTFDAMVENAEGKLGETIESIARIIDSSQ